MEHHSRECVVWCFLRGNPCQKSAFVPLRQKNRTQYLIIKSSDLTGTNLCWVYFSESGNRKQRLSSGLQCTTSLGIPYRGVELSSGWPHHAIKLAQTILFTVDRQMKFTALGGIEFAFKTSVKRNAVFLARLATSKRYLLATPSFIQCS